MAFTHAESMCYLFLSTLVYSFFPCSLVLIHCFHSIFPRLVDTYFGTLDLIPLWNQFENVV